MNAPEVSPLPPKKSRLETRIEQALQNRLTPEVPQDTNFDRNVEVVRLAIELARLRGNTKPDDHLNEVAKLITDAGIALEREKGRPELEVMEEIGAVASELIRSSLVAKDVILLSGKREGGRADAPSRHKIESDDGSFHWTTFKSEKGFRQLVEKHYGTIYAKAVAGLRPNLCQDSPKLADAENYIRANRLLFDTETVGRLKEVRNASDGSMFLSFWQARAVNKTVEAVLMRAKGGWLDSSTLKALAETRAERHTARSKKAAAAKVGKAIPRHRGVRARS